MPTVTDATVVASAYDTSGNGGRKLVRLSNGWLVSVLNSGTYATGIFLRVSKDNGSTWTQLCSIANAGYDVTLTNVGTKVYVFYYSSGVKMNVVEATTQTDINIASLQTTVDSVTVNTSGRITADYDGNGSIHFAHNSIIPAYPNSHNIRYTKGTIAADGSVAWGAVEQRTTDNTAGLDNAEPSIATHNGRVTIVFRRQMQINSMTHNGTAWGALVKVVDIGYQQSSPSAIFVPQSVNGSANGLIADTWDGFDATHTTTKYIRFSKSLDGGVTWSAMQKLVPGINGTLTANKSGKLFITYDDAGTTKRIESTDNGDTWSAAITVGAGTNPSSLFDLTMNMSVPLTIRKGATSVLFSGTWTVTTISVTPGDIGQKTAPTPLLTYSITTDGTMSAITERLNGSIIGIKTATSGENLIAGLTQAQWDTVRFGKYGNSEMVLSQKETDWVQGTIDTAANASPDTIITSTTRIRTKGTIPVTGGQTYKFSVKTGYSILVAEYNNANQLITFADWHAAGTSTRQLNAATVKVVIAVRKADNTAITTANLADAEPQFFGNAFHSNKLTVEMGGEKWTYTFDKRAATDADILSAVKAVKDSQEVYLPAVKAKMGAAIRGKGGTVSDADSWDVMASAVESLSGMKYASGTATASSATSAFQYATSTSTVGLISLTVTGLNFKPDYIYANFSNGTNTFTSVYSVFDNELYPNVTKAFTHSGTSNSTTNYALKADVTPASISSTGFVLALPGGASSLFKWFAIKF